MSVQTDRSRDGTDREGEASETNEPSFCDFRVRSVIILQDKPHDRERLLLKFLKIMKVVRVRSRKVLLSLHLYSKLVSVLALQSGRTAATPELIRLTNWNKKIYFYKLTASLQNLCVHLWFQTVVCCHVILSNCTCSFFPAAPEEAQ